MNGYQRKGEWLEWTCMASAVSPASPLEQLSPAQLRQLLVDQLRVSPKFAAALLHSGSVKVHRSTISLKLFPDSSYEGIADWNPLTVLYEDDFCFVADKPAGVKVHPTEPGETGTLLQRAAGHLLAEGESSRPRPIHRLDEWTSGPVLFAKCDYAQQKLDEAMRHKQIDRHYAAVVSGKLAKPRGVIEAPIGKDRHHASRRRVSAGGEPAVTHYSVAEQWADAALVRLRLETGRTHQIRVHMSYIGHPLLGDVLYGGKSDAIRRQALHGERLQFPHPWMGELVDVISPLPVDFSQLIEGMKKS